MRRLTPRQRQVVRLYAVGYIAEEIAEELGCTPATVRKHFEHAMLRTRSRNRVHLVARFERGEVA